MSGYVVMFRAMLDSTIWEENPDVRLTWITLLLMKDPDQVVRHPLRVVAKKANLCPEREKNYERVRVAMEVLKAPDTKSGDNQEFEGRRVRQEGDSFLVLNGDKYDEMVRELWARARKTAKQKARRDAARNGHKSTPLAGEVAALKHGTVMHEHRDTAVAEPDGGAPWPVEHPLEDVQGDGPPAEEQEEGGFVP